MSFIVARRQTSAVNGTIKRFRIKWIERETSQYSISDPAELFLVSRPTVTEHWPAVRKANGTYSSVKSKCSIVLTTSPLYALQRMKATSVRQENAIWLGSPVARRSRPGMIGIADPIPCPERQVPLNAMYIFVYAVGVVTTRRGRCRDVSPR